MKKRIIVFLFLSGVFLSCVFPETWSSQITAYKTNVTAGTPPNPVCTLFRILSPTNSEISSEKKEPEWIPNSYRNSEFDAFTWVLGGNVFGSVNVSFTFHPMFIDTENEDDYIPYVVELNHSNSRIGNTAISTGVGNETTSSSYAMTNDYTDYDYFFADSVVFEGNENSCEVFSSEETITVTYDMSKNTVIKQGTTVIHDRNAQTGAITNYNLSVCNYWNRYGSGTVLLKINADGSRLTSHPLYSSESTKFSSGDYYAEVVVSIWTNM